MDGSPCADRGPQIVATNALTPWDVQSRRIYDENGKMAALYSGEGRGSNNGAVFVRAAGFNGKARPSSGSVAYTKECTPTLIADHPMHVATYDMTHADEVMRPVKGGIAPTLNARMGTGGNQVPVVHCVGNGQLNQVHLQEKVGALNCTHDQQCVLGATVRRLTPLECERLQGLPDGYTEGGSDTARYKALGNGMAQPCANWVIQRIKEAIT